MLSYSPLNEEYIRGDPLQRSQLKHQIHVGIYHCDMQYLELNMLMTHLVFLKHDLYHHQILSFQTIKLHLFRIHILFHLISLQPHLLFQHHGYFVHLTKHHYCSTLKCFIMSNIDNRGCKE